jgi:hypothetical protein
MSFNFHQVKTHEQSELFRLRARIILDIETFMSDEERSNLALFPNFFQILQRKMRKAAEGERSPLNSVVVVLWLPLLFCYFVTRGRIFTQDWMRTRLLSKNFALGRRLLSLPEMQRFRK